jgi:hypothetical protein
MKLSTLIPGILLLSTSFTCCTRNEDPGTYPEKIILDTDMGSDCDDAGALALLNEYAREGKAEILGVIFSSGAVPYGVGVIDAINRYYDHHDIPIGACYDRSFGDPVDKMQTEKLSRDTSAFKNRYIVNTNVPEGYYTKDCNFFFNGTATYTDYLIDHFPGEIYFIAAGTDVMTGKSLMHTPGGNIVRTAYRDWLWNCVQQTLADQRPSWDLAAVCFAVESSGDYLQILAKGYLDFTAEEGSKWIRSDTPTHHRFVVQRDNIQDGFSDYLNGMISKHNSKD